MTKKENKFDKHDLYYIATIVIMLIIFGTIGHTQNILFDQQKDMASDIFNMKSLTYDIESRTFNLDAFLRGTDSLSTIPPTVIVTPTHSLPNKVIHKHHKKINKSKCKK